MKLRKSLLATLIAAAVAPATALATDGYFSHGYGMKGKGMAGVATARTDDTFGGANNPAQGVFVGDRVDVGIDWFSPVRSAERSGAAIPTLNGKVDSGRENFLIPEFGYNKMINPNMSLGITVYGNGGMNTAYPQGDFQCPTPTGFVAGNMVCGAGKLGVDFSQLMVAPTLAYKIAPNHALGIAPLFAYQRIKLDGLQLFGQLSGSPANVTNNDYDSSTGYGVRVGYLGRLSSSVSVGAAYASKMKMSKFDKYKGLFAGDGSFDIPENYNVGVMVSATPALSFGLDYKRINYNAINPVGNPSTNNQAPLGASNGPGFGWQDVDVWKLGVEYAFNSALTVRAGYGKSDNPILARDVTFNILAPGVVQDHYTLGLTYALNRNSEITVAYMHAAKQSVSGSSLFNGLFPVPNAGGTEKIQMYQNSLGIAWGMKL